MENVKIERKIKIIDIKILLSLLLILVIPNQILGQANRGPVGRIPIQIYQSDCSTYRGTGFCQDTDDGKIYYYDRVGAAITELGSGTITAVGDKTSGDACTAGAPCATYHTDIISIGPEVDARYYATIELANTAAYNAGKTLLISSNWTLTANTTLTAKVKRIPGGTFTKASTYTLALNGGFENPSNGQAFIGFTTITLPVGTIVYPEWFGAVGDKTTDDISALNQAVASTRAYDTLYLTKQYRIASQLAIDKEINLTGPGIIWLDVGTSTDGVVVGNDSTYTEGIRWDFGGIFGGAIASRNALVLKNVNRSYFKLPVMAGTVASTGRGVWIQWGIMNEYRFTISTNINYGHGESISANGVELSDSAGAATTGNANVFDCMIEGVPGKGLYLFYASTSGQDWIHGTYEGIGGHGIHVKGGVGIHISDTYLEAGAVNENFLVLENHGYGYIGPGVVSLPAGIGYDDVQLINADNTVINGLRTNRFNADVNSDNLVIVDMTIVGLVDADFTISGTALLHIDKKNNRVGIGRANPRRQLVVSGNNAVFEMIKANATADQGIWTIDAGSTDGTLYFQTMDDGESGGNTWLQVVRSGTTITSVSVPNGSFDVGGNTVLTTASSIDPDQFAGDTVDNDKVDGAILAPPAVQTVTCTAGAVTFTPTAGLLRVYAVIDPSGQNCTVTMGETGAVAGVEVTAVNLDVTYTVQFDTSSNVILLKHGNPYIAGAGHYIKLLYVPSYWLELGRNGSGLMAMDDSNSQFFNSATTYDHVDAKKVKIDASNQGAGQTGVIQAPVNGTFTAVAGTPIVKTQVFTKCFTVLAATTASDFPVEIFPYAITITGVRVYQVGATNVVGQFDECTGASGICTSLTTVDADITGTADAWVADDGSLTNPTIAANNGIYWHTTSVSGTNTSFTGCFLYTID